MSTLRHASMRQLVFTHRWLSSRRSLDHLPPSRYLRHLTPLNHLSALISCRSHLRKNSNLVSANQLSLLHTSTPAPRGGPAADESSSSSLKEFSEIPGPKLWPIIGSMFDMHFDKNFDPSNIIKYWESVYKKYGPIVKMKIVGMPILVGSTNPDDAETVHKSTMDNPIRNFFQSLKKVRYNDPNNYFQNKSGLLPENGEEWWRLRSRVQGPLLRPRNVAMYLPKVDAATIQFMDRIDLLQKESGGRVSDDFLEEIYKWGLECVGVVALNQQLGCLQPGLSPDSPQLQMIRHISDVLSALNEMEVGALPTWKLYRSKAYVTLETAHSAFLQVADRSIQEASRSLQEAVKRGDSDRSLTVMETFVNTEGLSKGDVATMILDMLFAGVDTTSHTVAFTLYLLAKNPDKQRLLQQEVDRVVGSATAELKPEQIAAMTYLNHVVKESLRLYPLITANARVLTEDIVMSGYKVPAGTITMNMHSLMCRDEKLFSRPNDFVPERWDRNRPLGPIHPFASLPFSHGKRMCIGKRIAEQEIYTFLARAMQKYTVTFEIPDEMQVKTQLVLKPVTPLAFKFHLRQQA